ncbi:LysR family transcriptional regulator [Xanthomonas sp. NCPPB 1128]|uniref:LysR family transcriptional regulator n=1 Tax=Xanthomonas sp. NCPPB 1128 TaxID=1775876 RepID=UPI00065AFF22|nr:LysR family transcriptional regulator [Xanthomonas sp. NCPPB 1128]KMM77398.1 LysR family transcriptional regulator [Xanthomonas sp. NCPPB 1128]
MDLDALQDFQLVAAHGGFGKASRASGRSKATLSRRLADFENALGVRLLERGGRSLVLTETGALLLSQTAGPMREIVEAVMTAREGVTGPRGRLRVAAPLLFSQVALGRLAARFRALYPDVQIEVVAEDRLADLVEEHFDVAIRVNPREEGGLVGRCFAKDRLILAAAPSVRIPADAFGEPAPIPAVVMQTHREGDVWSVGDGQAAYEPQPVLTLSSLLSIRDAVVAGAGAALLPQSIVGTQLDSGELVSWGIAGKDTQLWVMHTSRRLQSPKVKAFVEFMAEQYPTGWFVV